MVDQSDWRLKFKNLAFFLSREAGMMILKVAVASHDRQSVNEHFGQARHFLIYELIEDQFQLGEVREIDSPHCGEFQHDPAAIAKTAELLADCRFVLASEIGPGALEALRLKGIKGFAITGSIQQVLAKLAVSPEVKNTKNRSDYLGKAVR